MTTNPYIEQTLELRRETQLLIKHAHKFTVNGIYDYEKPAKEDIYYPMMGFCKENHIYFSLHPFNPVGSEEDREMIVRLPAYHVYINEEYETTLYPGETCTHNLKALILAQEKDRPIRKKWTWMPTITLSAFKLQFRRRQLLTSEEHR